MNYLLEAKSTYDSLPRRLSLPQTQTSSFGPLSSPEESQNTSGSSASETSSPASPLETPSLRSFPGASKPSPEEEHRERMAIWSRCNRNDKGKSATR